jgi:hypothetical protein
VSHRRSFIRDLLYVELKNFYQNVLVSGGALISTHSHLNAISGWLWELLMEPWRIVKGAACVQRPTTSTIPQEAVAIKKPLLNAVAAVVSQK